MVNRGNGERKIVGAIVVLIRNTTWRCGRLERLIVRHLHSRRVIFGNPEMPLGEMIRSFNVSGKKKSEFLDAVRRLERRNIIRTLNLVN